MIRFLTATVCMLAFCLRGSDAQPAVPAKAPTIVPVGSDTQEMGKIPSYGKKLVRFRCKNTGDAAGQILRFVPTCSCITASADKMRLEPQEEAVISVALDASLVQGTFKRVLWVETDNLSPQRFSLSLRGEVLPLFLGLPQSPQQIVLAEGATWTNRMTLTGATTNHLFLGTPIISTDTNKLRATATLVTHTQATNAFDITLAVTALAPGRCPLTLGFPVEGQPKLRPVKLSFDVRIGVELNVLPPQLLLMPTEQPLTRIVHVVTAEQRPATNALTWAPLREGVSVRVQQSHKSSALMATLTLSPEAVTNLLNAKDAHLTFHYPNHRPVNLGFFSEASANPAQDAKGH